MSDYNKKLWCDLFNYNKATLRKILADYGITRTKSLTKYSLIVKLYGILKENDQKRGRYNAKTNRL